MKKIGINIILVVVICFLVCYPMSNIFNNYFHNNLDVSLKPNWILSKKNQHFDFGVLGSSRVINLVDIQAIEQKNKNEGINLGVSGTGLAESYILLSKFLKNGNSIDTLFLEINPNLLNAKMSFSLPFHPYFYFQYIKEDEIGEVYKDCVPDLKYYLWRFVPMASYFEYNNFFPLAAVIKSNKQVALNDFDKFDGSELMKGNEFAGLIKLEEKKLGINDIDKKYLLKIIDLAKAKMIPLIAYTAPELKEIGKYEQGRKAVYYEIYKILEKEKIDYHNFSSVVSDTLYFRDYLHLNENGIKTFSNIMADSLFANPILP